MPNYTPDFTVTEQDLDILKVIAAWQLGDGIEFKSIDGNGPTPAKSTRYKSQLVPLNFALVDLHRPKEGGQPWFEHWLLLIDVTNGLAQFGLVEIRRSELPGIPRLGGRPVDSTYATPSGSTYAVRFVDDRAFIVPANTRCPRVELFSPDVLVFWNWTEPMEFAFLTQKGLGLLQEVPATAKAETEAVSKPRIEPGTRQHDILVAMLRLGAMSRDTRKPFREIVREAFGRDADPNSYRDANQLAKDAGCVEAAKGQLGGCWLTPAGVQAVKAK